MIDIEIAGMDKTGMDPVRSLSNHLRISENIHECMHMIPVWVETGLLTINEDLLKALAHEESPIRKLNHDYYKLSTEVKDLLITAILWGRRKSLDDSEDIMASLEEIHQTLTQLNDYIYQFDDPSDWMLSFLTDICTMLPLLHRWHQVALICSDNEKKGFLSQIKRSESNWKIPFEQFMLQEGQQFPPVISH